MFQKIVSIFAWKIMLKKTELFLNGYHLTEFKLPSHLKKLVKDEKWKEVDEIFKNLTSGEGHLFGFLKQFHDFNSIEFIISIRDATNVWEEDGIWHDDGSRVFAFSLSLTIDEVEGGILGIRQKNKTHVKYLPTPQYGGIIMFLTGRYSYEHKIHQVTKGRRIIIAGWCS